MVTVAREMIPCPDQKTVVKTVKTTILPGDGYLVDPNVPPLKVKITHP